MFEARRRFLKTGAVWSLGVGHVALALENPSNARRRLGFNLVFTNPGGAVLRGQRFWMYLPVKRSGSQELLTVNASAPHQLHHDPFGHTVLELTIEELFPYGQKIVSLSVDVALRSVALQEPVGNDWRRAERYIEASSPEVMALAASLRRPAPQETAKAIYEWVAGNIAYAGYRPEDYGAKHVLKTRRGDCTEYAYLVTALARALDIPARMVGGYVTDRDRLPTPEDYHNWAELYFDGRWQLVDAQKQFWLTPLEHYIAFRYFREEAHPLLHHAHRFRVEGTIKAGV